MDRFKGSPDIRERMELSEAEGLREKLSGIMYLLEGREFYQPDESLIDDVYTKLLEADEILKELIENIVCNTSLAEAIEKKDNQMIREIELRANEGRTIRII